MRLEVFCKMDLSNHTFEVAYSGSAALSALLGAAIVLGLEKVPRVCLWSGYSELPIRRHIFFIRGLSDNKSEKHLQSRTAAALP